MKKAMKDLCREGHMSEHGYLTFSQRFGVLLGEDEPTTNPGDKSDLGFNI